MKKQKNSINRLSKLSIFTYLIFIAVGIISVSCATIPPENKSRTIMVNTGKDEEGKIYTSWVFDSIDSVSIFASTAKSKEVELGSYEWKYDPSTSELVIRKEIPDSSIISIKGKNAVPCSFILTKIDTDEKPMVILDNRFAIEGYDYTFDPSNNKLTFRDDMSLKNIDFQVSYHTPIGGASISEIKAKNMDQIAYLETYYRKQYLDSWYDKQDSFWFFEENGEEGKPPLLVKRKATTEELAEMKASSFPVLKFRNTKFKSISKEVGFNISLPEIVKIESPNMEFNTFGKFISGYSKNNKLVETFMAMYRNEGEMLIDVTVFKDNLEENENPKWIISENTLELLGKEISRTRQWAMSSSGPYNINEKPEIISMTSWEWKSAGAKYLITGKTEEEEIYGKFIREIIRNEK